MLAVPLLLAPALGVQVAVPALLAVPRDGALLDGLRAAGAGEGALGVSFRGGAEGEGDALEGVGTGGFGGGAGVAEVAAGAVVCCVGWGEAVAAGEAGCGFGDFAGRGDG